VIPYRAMLDVPAELLRYLTRLLAAERRRRGTPARSRKLSCRDQALLALRWFRDRTRPVRLAADHAISRATAYRYIDEAVDVLSAQAPGLDEALERALADGVPYVILDGKIFETDRLGETVTSAKGEEIDAWHSGKKHRPGANVQAVMLPSGLPAWASGAEPGHVHDITAARASALPLLYRAAAAGMPTLADGGYEGAGIGIHVPVKNPPGNQRLDPDTKTRNSLLRGLRSQGERGFALLSQRWTTLQRITASPRRTTEIVRAALVLTQFEHKYLTRTL
jgi:DDE superfamily endonuclease